MKIRHGFISNSSSSSFIVAFAKEPKTAEDVKKILFKNFPFLLNPYYSEDNKITPSFPAEQVSQTIFEMIKDQKPNDRKAIYKSIRNGWFDGMRNEDEFKTGKKNQYGYDEIDDEAYDKKNDSIAHKLANNFLSINSDQFVYVFEFSDNDGEYFSSLEHGDLFGDLHHIVTSYH